MGESKYIDISQQRFGKLVALQPLGRDAHGMMHWDCRCDCGGHVDASASSLRLGRRTHCANCGPSRAIDLTGQRFDRLLVIARAGRNEHTQNAEWLCVCDCGQRTVVDGYQLRRGHVRSCGCLRRELSAARAHANPALRSERNGKRLLNQNGIYFSSLIPGKRNKTGCVGVSYDKDAAKYTARLRWHGRYVLNRTAPTLAEAIALRKQAEAKYFPRDPMANMH